MASSDDLNYFRLCKLLIDYGTAALHDCLGNELQKKYPNCKANNPNNPVDMHTVLSEPGVHSLLQGLPWNVFIKKYRGLLYPGNKPSTTAEITNFDITLTVLLLRHICSFNDKSPAWNNPQPGDMTTEAVIGRLKQKRNMYAHKSDTVIADSEFKINFSEIRDTILKLSSKFSKADLDAVGVCGMNDEEKLKWMEAVNQWYDEEMGHVASEVKKIGATVDEVKNIGVKVSDDIRKALSSMKHTHKDLEQEGSEMPVRTRLILDCPATTVQGNTSNEDTIEFTQLQQSLAEMYLQTYTNIQRIPWDEGDTMNIDDVFVELNLLEEVHKPSKTERKKLDSFQDALKPNEDGVRPTRVIARGKAGSGKTTLVSKIAVDWARMILSQDDVEQETIMQNYKLLLIVNLRAVQKDASLHSVLQSQIFEQSDKVSSILNYMEKNPKSAILLLDGYDEYKDSLCTELSNIIKSLALRDVCVVVTTRPWKAEELCIKRQSYVHIEITGLSVQNVKKYIARFFGIDEAKLKSRFDSIFNEPASESSEPNVRNAQQLFEYVELNGMLSDGVLPLILLFTCLLWQDRSGENMPDTQVHLYREIVNLIVRRYCEHPSNTDNTELHSIIESYFEPLGRVALKGLLSPERGLLFDAKRIKEVLNDVDDHVYKSGLLSKVKDRSKLNKSYMLSFPHKSIQEYFAGIYVAKILESVSYTSGTKPAVSDTDVQSFLDHLNSMARLADMPNVILHACSSSSVQVGKILLRQIHQVALGDDKLSCLFNQDVCTKETFLTLEEFRYSGIFQFNAILYTILSEINQNHTLDSEHLHSLKAVTLFNTEDYNHLNTFVDTPAFKQNSGNIVGLDIHIYETCVQHAQQFLTRQGFHNLSYLKVNVDSYLTVIDKHQLAGLYMCLNKLIEVNCALRILYVEGYVNCRMELRSVCHTPIKNEHLEILHLSNFQCSLNDFNQSYLPNLTHLDLKFIEMSHKAYVAFLKTLKHTPQLISLKLNCIMIIEDQSDDGGVSGSGHCIDLDTHDDDDVNCIHGHDENFDVDRSDGLSSADVGYHEAGHVHDVGNDSKVEDGSGISRIHSHNSDPVSILCDALSQMCSLRHLKLESMIKSPLDVSKLAEVIPCLPHLRTLDASRSVTHSTSDPTPAWISLFNSLHHTPDPTPAWITLFKSLHHTPDPTPAWISLFNSLHHTPDLTELNLSECDLSRCKDKHQLMLALGNTMQHVPKLEKLDLHLNFIGDSVVCISDSLQYVPELKYLDLSWDDLSHEGHDRLIVALDHNLHHVPKLEWLHTSDGFSGKQLDRLTQVVHHHLPHLKKSRVCNARFEV